MTMNAAQRQAASRAKLVDSGGKRVSLNLSAQAVADIDTLVAQGHQTATMAVEYALRVAARKKPRAAR